jgi:hypothetical protein
MFAFQVSRIPQYCVMCYECSTEVKTKELKKSLHAGAEREAYEKYKVPTRLPKRSCSTCQAEVELSFTHPGP